MSEEQELDIWGFDDHLTTTAVIAPFDDNIKIDYSGLIAYAREHYEGVISKMGEEEVRQFVTDLSEQRKTA